MNKDVLRWILLVVNAAPIQDTDQAKIKAVALNSLVDMLEAEDPPEDHDL